MLNPSKKVIVVLGIVGRTPVAGVGWQVLHYLEGLRRLGHEVYYVEDSGDWPYDPVKNTVTDDPSFTVGYIVRLMGFCNLRDRWAYISAAQDRRVYGLSDAQLADLFRRADALINVTGATVLREEHCRVPIRIFVETDPVLPQIEVAGGNQFTTELLAAHTHLFTFGENLGAADCQIPLGRFTYFPTRQPVVVDWWDGDSGSNSNEHPVFTTISNWKQSGKDIEWNGETYLWSKHLQFLKFIDLPQRTTQPLEVALASDDPEVIAMWRSYGWGVVDAMRVSSEILPYRDYIKASRGEFTVAKDQYVRMRSGWFSDRSACYLAAGKPVITQDTLFGKFIPTGEGLFAYSDMDGILDAIETVNSGYEKHSRAAHELALEHFDAKKVVADMLVRAGV